ncbi:FadR/GntR family transcriptional regulator [Arthrobacter sunyaminii]|uniref:FCD domain-containing protein n=1 Tax=Arthrobacter sunyaminii TaxID=2816859 RepID=A0A975S7M2_9MICC|nr:FCD domain-containing protein [Arthrobacter sunyaminii]MBO0908333.1 FadR family transcriptional regulator [Arthrobacter sunyaminii]QWQ37319.1 FCD domain-containing protein [Arthrobacter sunyaminii]
MSIQSSSRAHDVAALLSSLSESSPPGARLGQKNELRERSGASSGSFNEGLKIAQDRGAVEVRRGPGGGIFAVERTVLGRLGGELMTLDTGDPSVAEALRMRNTLDPLVVSDALDHATMADITRLREHLGQMEQSIKTWDMNGFMKACTNYQRHVLSLSPNAMLRPVYGALLDILEREGVPISTMGGAVNEEGLRARLAFFMRMTAALESRDREAAYAVMVESTVGWRPYLPRENSAPSQHP